MRAFPGEFLGRAEDRAERDADAERPAPGRTCSISSHLLRAMRNFIVAAWRQTSDSNAVFPIPGGPEINNRALDPY